MDLKIVLWIAEHLQSPMLDRLMIFFTTLGEAGAIWIAVTAVLLFRKKTRKWGITMIISMLLMLLFGELLLKNLIARPRPFTHLPQIALLIPPPTSFSCPSGHTMSSFAGAVTLFLMNRKVGWWAILLAALIAFSRVYLSVHYPTDLLLGAVLGAVCAFSAYLLVKPAPLS